VSRNRHTDSEPEDHEHEADARACTDPKSPQSTPLPVMIGDDAPGRDPRTRSCASSVGIAGELIEAMNWLALKLRQLTHHWFVTQYEAVLAVLEGRLAEAERLISDDATWGSARKVGAQPSREELFEGALGMTARIGALPWLARTQDDYAKMLLLRGRPGDHDRARELLT
jgi:hypothetical protein